MAEKKFFVDINLQGSALTNAKIGTNSGIGSTEGAFGYDSASHRLQYFNGSATQNVANLSDISAVTGGLIFQGGYDPTTNTPDIADGTALKGFFWAATAAGTFLGESVQVGDSIVAKVDNAGATIADWLILQGNIVIATDSVDGISRLATQTEANDGTEGGAVVITPATLQGKIDAQITPEISSKLPLAGGTMSGDIDMDGNDINNVAVIRANGVFLNGFEPKTEDRVRVYGDIDFMENAVLGVKTPTNGTDAANKTYVDGGVAQALTDANAYSDSLAPNYDAAGSAATAEANANAYTDTEIAATRFSANIQTTDWTVFGGDPANGYIATITHNLNCYYPIIQLNDDNTGYAVEMATRAYSLSQTNVFSNTVPSGLVVASLVETAL